jgi:hypothetical protein
VRDCLFEELADMYFDDASEEDMLEQLKHRPEDLSKACSGYKNEAL